MRVRRIAEHQIDRLIKDLRDLSYNLWWSWNPAAQQIFHELSPFFWEHSCHNPVEVMHWVSGQELRGRLRSPEFFERVKDVCTQYRTYMTVRNTWAKKHARKLGRGPVAYFSAEFGLHESLRIYSGGLGVLAGDHAKSASNLGIPFIGVSLFYRQGYFQQHISREGWQQEQYPTYDPQKLPMTQVVDAKGNLVECTVELNHSTIHVRAWWVHVGRIRVLLLDTDHPRNEDRHRELTAHVYGGDQSTRIAQELVLGIGGVRMLRALNITPTVFHMNEGHSAFLTLELLRERLSAGNDLSEAEQYVRSHCVFTTHTPVPAGHDRFDRGLMEHVFAKYSQSLGLTIDQLMGYGRITPENSTETFCMTVLALRMSRDANGVSELHGQVSREMWRGLYPHTPVNKINIGHITNGVHITGWTAPSTSEFLTARLGRQWIERIADKSFWRRSLAGAIISDADLWALRTTLRRELVEFVRRRLREQDLANSSDSSASHDHVLSPHTLTIGFARRFATYKRAPLFFRDLDWAIRILTDATKPVQIVFAGKAHPRDDAGKHLIQQIIQLTRRKELAGRVIFLENYDIAVARQLVAGCDLWLNTPRRPMEASGTSGMKVAINGGLHCSTMDGWWREAFDGRNGWRIGEDTTAPSEAEQDDKDAVSLRAVMEGEIIPLFYQRDKHGVPHGWLKRVRHAMATLIPQYNTDRMVAEYTTRYYFSDKQRPR